MNGSEPAFAGSASPERLFPFAVANRPVRTSSAPAVGREQPGRQILAQDQERAFSATTTALPPAGDKQCPVGTAKNLWLSSSRWPMTMSNRMSMTAGSVTTLLSCSEPGTPREVDVESRQQLWSAELKRGRLLRCQTNEFLPSLAGMLAQSLVREGCRPSNILNASALSLPSEAFTSDLWTRPASAMTSSSDTNRYQTLCTEDGAPSRVVPGGVFFPSATATPDVSGRASQNMVSSPGSNGEFGMTPMDGSPSSPGKKKRPESRPESKESQRAASINSEELGYDAAECDTWSGQVLRNLLSETQRLAKGLDSKQVLQKLSTADITKAFGLTGDHDTSQGPKAARATDREQAQEGAAGAVKRPMVPGLNLANVHMGEDDDVLDTADDEDFKNKVGHEALDRGVASHLPQPDPEQRRQQQEALGMPKLDLLKTMNEASSSRKASATRMQKAASAAELRSAPPLSHQQQLSMLLPSPPAARHAPAKKSDLSVYIYPAYDMAAFRRKGPASRPKMKRVESASALRLPPMMSIERQMQIHKSQKLGFTEHERKNLLEGQPQAAPQLQPGRSVVVHSHMHNHYHVHNGSPSRSDAK